MKNDNTTPHSSAKYDTEIIKTIPYYPSMHLETVKLVKSFNKDINNWLDTGCGTGTLASLVLENFPQVNMVLADPSNEMLGICRTKLTKDNYSINYINSDTGTLTLKDYSFDVITTIQAHHYLKKDQRGEATSKCYSYLKPGGIYIAFENIRPRSDDSTTILKKYWKQFQVESGKEITDAEKHIQRFDVEYFPITIEEHLKLYETTGFKVADMFWKSYMQAGFFCIKE